MKCTAVIAVIALAQWSEQEFLKKTEGSAIRRIGYQAWLRNIYVALGNAPFSTEIIALLEKAKRIHANNALLLDHINWGIQQQMVKF